MSRGYPQLILKKPTEDVSGCLADIGFMGQRLNKTPVLNFYQLTAALTAPSLP
jgi:hypothetical protein